MEPTIPTATATLTTEERSARTAMQVELWDAPAQLLQPTVHATVSLLVQRTQSVPAPLAPMLPLVAVWQLPTTASVLQATPVRSSMEIPSVEMQTTTLV